jgi:pilus assembly protein CpaF
MNLEDIFADLSVEDIILAPKGLLYFRESRWHGPIASPICADNAQLWELARKIAESASLGLGLTQPTVDAIVPLGDGENFRAHVVIPPMILEGPQITLRRLPKLSRFPLESFCGSPEECESLRSAVLAGESLLVAGPTGSGKSTLLTALLAELGSRCRVIILEDSPELPLPNALSEKLLARSNRFGFREGAQWDLSQLVFESLRMRPERLVLGECRGPEALALAHALHTGHRGLMATLHAGSATEAMERFCELAAAQSDFSHEQLERVWDKIVVVENSAGQRRRVREIWSRE